MVLEAEVFPIEPGGAPDDALPPGKQQVLVTRKLMPPDAAKLMDRGVRRIYKADSHVGGSGGRRLPPSVIGRMPRMRPGQWQGCSIPFGHGPGLAIPVQLFRGRWR